ncbi:MAG: MFS transporter [Nocardiopsaceae bacterium]|nr:MFS transporter [Nocardiopsaceae bacterium]
MTSRSANSTASFTARPRTTPEAGPQCFPGDTPGAPAPARAHKGDGPKPAGKTSFTDVFKVGEFRALWASQILSVGGDRLALVALTLLIYDRTRSPLLAAIAYAAGNVPYILGALFLSGLADRFGRRGVMVTCDLIRAALVIAMLIPGMSLYALIALLYVVTTVQPPFDAARSAVLGDILTGEKYAVGAATMQMTMRMLVVGGAAVGGLTVALVGARPALGIDAATFIASGVLVRAGLRARSAAASTSRPNGLSLLFAGIRLVFADKALRTLMLIGWLAAFYEIPEGIAAPYAGALHAGAVATGLVIATSQIGAVIFTPAFAKGIGPLRRLRWMGPMAALACGILVITAVRPGLVGSMVVFAVSGSFAIYQIAANTAFVQRVPNERRAQAFGVANAGLVVGQGVAFAVAGFACEFVPPATVVAVGGGVGAVIAIYLALRWRGMSPAVGRHSARHLARQVTLAGQSPVSVAD